MKQLLIFVYFFLPLACFAQQEFRTTRVVNLSEMTVPDFIAEVQQYNKDSISTFVFSILDRAPKDWIRKEDMPMLMQNVRSDKPSKCIVSMFSSYLPERKEHSTLGGIAMDMIDAYRKKEGYPQKLALCTVGDKNRVAEMEKWWKTEAGK